MRGKERGMREEGKERDRHEIKQREKKETNKKKDYFWLWSYF